MSYWKTKISNFHNENLVYGKSKIYCDLRFIANIYIVPRKILTRLKKN